MGIDAQSSDRVRALIEEHADDIQKRWIELVLRTARGRTTEVELSKQSVRLFSALITAMPAGADAGLDRPEAAELRDLLGDLSRNQARRGYTPSETASVMFALKDAVAAGVAAADRELLAALVTFGRFVDELALVTFDSYTQTREELIVEQNEQLLELSTPVIKLWDGVVAVPLVGTLDSARAQVVMEKLLQTLVDTGSGYAIIDITGVPAVDTQVAQHILKTVMAARLMGAECAISGIRPQIAQTVVSLGIEFGDIVTKATLADALVQALRSVGVGVVRRDSRRDG